MPSFPVLSQENIGLGFTLLFIVMILVFSWLGLKSGPPAFRYIPAFSRLRRSLGIAIEAGKRLHFSLGWGGVYGVEGGSGQVGLSLLRKILGSAAASDRPPVATSGEAALAIFSQETIQSAESTVHADRIVSVNEAQLSGLTPFSYAAGSLPVVQDHQVAANLIIGHFGVEVALITDAGERTGSLTLAGSDSLSGQSVLFVTAQEPLLGEELYASGAFMQVNRAHVASVIAQDVLRWVVILSMIGGALLKLLGVL